MSVERIQKLLAEAGIGSRRQIETWIREKRIKINGEYAELGQKIRGNEQITLNNRRLHLPSQKDQQTRVLIYHKPVGEICSRNDPEGRPDVFASLPPIKGQRWIMVGRLDINTSGLLLFTNNGELAHQLMHPRNEIPRIYAVRILGEVQPAMLRRLTQGVRLDDGMAAFSSIQDAGGEGANHWYHVTLHEGRNREVRRLWESQGVQVSRLIRIGFANIDLPRDLRAGRYRELLPQVVRRLFN